jgi:hypothetical protein
MRHQNFINTVSTILDPGYILAIIKTNKNHLLKMDNQKLVNLVTYNKITC